MLQNWLSAIKCFMNSLLLEFAVTQSEKTLSVYRNFMNSFKIPQILNKYLNKYQRYDKGMQ